MDSGGGLSGEAEGLHPGLQREDVVGFSGGSLIELDMTASKILSSSFVLIKTHSKVYAQVLIQAHHWQCPH